MCTPKYTIVDSSVLSITCECCLLCISKVPRRCHVIAGTFTAYEAPTFLRDHSFQRHSKHTGTYSFILSSLDLASLASNHNVSLHQVAFRTANASQRHTSGTKHPNQSHFHQNTQTNNTFIVITLHIHSRHALSVMESSTALSPILHANDYNMQSADSTTSPSVVHTPDHTSAAHSQPQSHHERSYCSNSGS